MARRGRRRRAGARWLGKPFVSMALLDAVLSCSPAQADDGAFELRNSFGEVGLLDMPSARMSDDGQIGVTLSTLSKNIQRYNFSFQVLPWLQGSFRYSRIATSTTTLSTFDRSFGLKMRLWHEEEFLPEVSLGIRDLLGTGIYGSEYLVASKEIGSFDFTAGLGWGRLADNETFPNPFGYLISSFRQRSFLSGPGGQVDFGQFFHGPSVGLFGGVVWRTPINNLNLVAEYSGDRYKNERLRGSFDVKMPINVGLAYQFRTASISAGWFYGSSFGATLTLTLDPTKNLFPAKIGVPPLPATNRSDAQKTAALNALLEGRDAAFADHGTPSLPVAQAMFGLAHGVRSLTQNEHNLTVAVSLNANEPLSCASYASLASHADTDIRSVIVTDIGNGRSENCAAPQAVRPAQLSWMSAIQHAPAIIDATGAVGTALIPTHSDQADAFSKIRKSAGEQSLRIDALSIARSELVVYYENSHYLSESEAVGRLLRVLMTYAPPDNEVFRIVTVQFGVPVREVRVLRSAIERATEFDGGTQELGRTISVQLPPMQNSALDEASDSLYPHFSWSISPQTRQSVFDPNSPLQVQAFVTGKAGAEILPGLSVSGQIDLNIWNNFITTPSNSVLPHVRSDIARYLKDGATGIANLMITYHTRIAPEVFAELKGGYLEDMFAGVGGQVLWRPDNSRLSVGADIYHVWQRDFDRRFGLQPYDITTGHVSLYYNSPWYGLNFNVHAGRYLAGDYGATFELTRRFDTGIELGAYATFTTVPFSQYGEGSFDKGIIARIPLEWGLPIHSTKVFDATLRSLSRDGGQRLKDDDSLYNETVGVSYGEINRHLNDVLDP